MDGDKPIQGTEEEVSSRPITLQNMMESALTKGDLLHTKAFQVVWDKY